jgi:UDP-N-acetylmuramyl pentapeptide phosphotransferase/UDP-N-acetylglucosamine-1-phosphate transferase
MQVRWKEFFGIGALLFIGSIVVTFLINQILEPEYWSVPMIVSGLAFLGWLIQVIYKDR